MRRLLALAAMLLLMAGCEQPAPPPSFTSTDITGAPYARDFTLVDHNGKPRSLADFRGKVVVLFFGFTQCPDVCPTTLAEMAAVMQELGERAKEVQVLLVTLDPERDSQALLAEYVPAFHPSFLGLRGDSEATAAVAKEFKVFFAKAPGKDAGSYSIDHTAASFVFDKDGKVRLYVRPGQGPKAIAADIRQLL